MPQSPRSSRRHDTHLRLTAAEYQRAQELAAASRTSVANVLRAGLNNQPMLKAAPPVVPAFDLNAIRELRRIGSNINQLIRELYRHDRQSITLEELHQIDKEIQHLVAVVYLGRDAAQQLLSERFSQWFAGVRQGEERT